MKSIRSKWLAAVTAVCMLFSLFSATEFTARNVCAESADTTPLTNLLDGWPEMGEINEASGVVMDADTGGILYSLNRDTIRYPASTTKILTALVALENASMDEIVTMDSTGVYYTTDGSTNAGTVEGEEFTVEQCLYVMLLKSANDIATQLGKHVGGEDLDHFVEMMNERAAEIGCENSHFVNPSGMPDTEHYSTAEDMALIMQECLKNETFRKIIATTSYTVPATNKTSEARTYENHCKLILPGSEFYYEYCIGGKTGYTEAAWRTLVCAAEKDGKTLVAVTMRGPDNTDFSDMKNLFEYGFNQFTTEELDGVAVDLPEGFDVSLLSEEKTELSDGSTRITWKYNNLPVGSGTVQTGNASGSTAATADAAGTESEVPAESLTVSAAETNGAQVQADTSADVNREEESAGIKVIRILISVLAVAALSAIIFGIVWYFWFEKNKGKRRGKRRSTEQKDKAQSKKAKNKK